MSSKKFLIESIMSCFDVKLYNYDEVVQVVNFRPDRLEKERSRQGWTQEDVANKIGVARPTYSNYENGNREPDFKIMRALSDLFDVSMDYLTGKSDYRNEQEILSKSTSGGRAYYGGGKDWTPEEHAAADALVEMMRKRREEERKREEKK
jgi:transcriptional regulator with XRE-family HTH domain